MTTQQEPVVELKVNFVGLEEGEEAPRLAAYEVDSAGQPIRKIGRYDGKVLRFAQVDTVALGPDVEDIATLTPESLVRYRVDQNLVLWRRQGLVLAPELWRRFLFLFVCVSGTVRKCRPWFWDLLDDIRLRPTLELAQVARYRPITADLQQQLWFPFRCQPMCDGVVEVFERECCCFHIPIPDLLDRLRDILDIVPIPLPDPFPDPIPGPFPGPFPGPGPYPGPLGTIVPGVAPGLDPALFNARQLRNRARLLQTRAEPPDLSALPSEELYQDYLALRVLPLESARQYVLDRPYLFPLFCRCSVRKVGQAAIQPGGHFDLCYLRVPARPRCYRTYAYRIRQLIDGVSTVVYDGLAAKQYFSAGAPADIRIYNPRALTCADGPGDPPPNDGTPFVMLEYVGNPDTNHFNFPAQDGQSQTMPLGADSGTYTTTYAPDCPWGGALGLRLWFSPSLEATVKYYRFKVVGIDDTGSPVGTPIVLNDTVAWDKLVDGKRAAETLGPLTVNGVSDLFRVPYWDEPDRQYLTGQFHQVWNTARTTFPDGKYMLVLEVFNGDGARIEPVSVPGPGGENFEFRRWISEAETANVPHADLVNVFWVDNTPVVGDIVDLRKGDVKNSDECQYISGEPDSEFSIGFRAYHVHGVQQGGVADHNSFMYGYSIRWHRGLNGLSGALGPAPGLTYHTDVGEIGGPVSSGSASFESMLTRYLPGGGREVLGKCTFSVRLYVTAKHFNGMHHLSQYDYDETAAFALEIT